MTSEVRRVKCEGRAEGLLAPFFPAIEKNEVLRT